VESIQAGARFDLSTAEAEAWMIIPEEDHDKETHEAYEHGNTKTNEFLFDVWILKML
jgi:hypothetical protein